MDAKEPWRAAVHPEELSWDQVPQVWNDPRTAAYRRLYGAPAYADEYEQLPIAHRKAIESGLDRERAK